MPTTARTGVLAATVLLAFIVWQLAGWPNPETVNRLSLLTFVALGLVHVPLAVLTAIGATGRRRIAWAIMAIALASWLLDDVFEAWFTITADRAPAGIWIDLIYLAYLPTMGMALLLLTSANSWRSQGQIILDSIVVTGSFFLIFWLAALRSVWRSADGSTVEIAVSLAFPTVDVLVLTIGILVLGRAAPGLRLPLALFVAALTCAAFADTVWVYQANSTGTLSNILYVANGLLVIVALVAANHAEPDDASVPASTGWLSRWLPLVPVVLAALSAAGAPPGTVLEAPVVITGLLVIAGLLLRQLLEAAELARREREVRLMADQLAADLDSAADYVASILPAEMTGLVQISSRYLPSRVLGGDTFGYAWVDEDHLIVYLIDVSGHGIKPALLSVSVHNLLRSQTLPSATLVAPERVVAELNTRFGMDRQGDHYFTMFYGVYQASTQVLSYVNAGHPPAVCLTADNGVVRSTPLTGESLPVGMFPDSDFAAESYRVPPGARILLYSDGALGERLTFAEFEALCSQWAAEPVWSLDSLTDQLRADVGGTFEDDFALVELTF